MVIYIIQEVIIGKIKEIKLKLSVYFKNNRKRAFSLVEVLLTITIIGIIASITIPTLIQNVQTSYLKEAWKETYSTFNQANTRLLLDNAGSLKGIFTSQNGVRDSYAKYLTYTKSCDSGQTMGNCWHAQDGSSKWLNGTPATGETNLTGLILTNGALVYMGWESTNCTKLDGTLETCAFIAVDVNGWKKPNTYGRDIFWIHVLENGIKPYGVIGDAWQNDCDPEDDGIGCSADYLKQ